MDPSRQGSNDVELVQGQARGGSNAPNMPTVSPTTAQPSTEPRPAPGSERPYGGIKHVFARKNPVPMFDNLRTTLTLLVILYNSILEVVANTPDQDEKTAPIQFLVLSNFVGLYRNFVIGLFFFVSGFGSVLSMNVYNKSVPLFIFHRSTSVLLLCLYAAGSPLLARYVYELKPNDYPGPGQSYYDSRMGRATLLIGPIAYLAVIFCFDISYGVFRVFKNQVGTQNSRVRYLVWVAMAFVSLTLWSILAAGGRAPTIGSIWPKYNAPIHDFHFPMQYIIGYLTGLFLPSVWALYLPITPARRAIPTFLSRLCILCATFTCLYLLSPDMKDQLQYASPKMPPSFTQHAHLPKLSGINKPAIIYALWSTLVYFFMTNSFHLLFISEATESAVQGLKRNWGFVSRLSRFQAYNNFFFVIFFAAHVQWIGPLILKCIFVWVASTFSGYLVAAMWEFVYQRILGWATAQMPQKFSKADAIKSLWKHTNGTVDEKSVELFKTLLGDPKAGNAVEIGADGNASQDSGELLSLTEGIGEVPETPLDSVQIEDDNEPEEQNYKSRSHNIDNLRTTLMILLVFRYAVVQVIANAPKQTQATVPIQFAILQYFVNLNRTTVVAMLYFVSGMWSTHTMDVLKGSRYRFIGIKAVRTVFLLIAYFSGSKLVRFMYNGLPSGSGSPPVPSVKDAGVILTDGSMFYVLLLFVFDFIHAFTAKKSTSGPSNQSGFEIPLDQYRFAQYYWTGLSRIITAACVYILTCVWRGPTWFFYFDPQFIILYGVAYFSGIHFSSTMIYTFLSANVLGGRPTLTLILRTLFSVYFIHLGSSIQAFTTLGIPTNNESPKWTSILAYGFFVPSICLLVGPSILLLFFQKPALMRGWGLFSRVTLVQPVLQTFLVIGLARQTGWIGNLLARCVFVGVSSVVCGWIVAVVPLVVWRLVVSVRRERRGRYVPLDSGVSA